MSLTEISVRVAIVTVLALVALVAIGWRRSAPRYPHRVQRSEAPPTDARSTRASTSTAPMDDPLGAIRVGRFTSRKVLDVVGLGSIAAFVGILVALVTSTAIAWMVTALLNRL